MLGKWFGLPTPARVEQARTRRIIPSRLPLLIGRIKSRFSRQMLERIKRNERRTGRLARGLTEALDCYMRRYLSPQERFTLSFEAYLYRVAHGVRK